MRVLFTSTSGWGHIHPMVPPARAFLDRGDDVLWATGGEVCGRLEREGIATAVAGLDDGVAMSMFYERYPEVSDVPPPERSDFMFPRLFGPVRAEAMLADLVPAARAYAPDLLVPDSPTAMLGHSAGTGATPRGFLSPVTFSVSARRRNPCTESVAMQLAHTCLMDGSGGR